MNLRFRYFGDLESKKIGEKNNDPVRIELFNSPRYNLGMNVNYEADNNPERVELMGNGITNSEDLFDNLRGRRDGVVVSLSTGNR